jgi:glycosyltransferase involved in cell wall biosynthesis
MGVKFEVLHGSPQGDQAMRADSVTAPYAIEVPTRIVRVGSGGSLRWKAVVRRTSRSDLTIVELAAGAVEALILCAGRPRRTALWGHGYAAVSRANRFDTGIEGWMMRRAQHLFLYTERGAAAAERAGTPRRRITVLDNTIDTQPIIDAADGLDGLESRRRLGLGDHGGGPVGAFIGGLDQSKRIGFLLATVDRLQQFVPTFTVVVAGDGALRSFVEAAAASRPWMHYVGPIDEAGKGALANVADVLLNPGRVGLIAVDSFAMAVPIVTTRRPFHAPELDYLEDGRTAVFTADTVDAYASAVAELLHDDERRRRMADACRSQRSRFGIDAMADRFVDGVSISLAALPPLSAPC